MFTLFLSKHVHGFVFLFATNQQFRRIAHLTSAQSDAQIPALAIWWFSELSINGPKPSLDTAQLSFLVDLNSLVFCWDEWQMLLKPKKVRSSPLIVWVYEPSICFFKMSIQTHISFGNWKKLPFLCCNKHCHGQTTGEVRAQTFVFTLEIPKAAFVQVGLGYMLIVRQQFWW